MWRVPIEPAPITRTRGDPPIVMCSDAAPPISGSCVRSEPVSEDADHAALAVVGESRIPGQRDDSVVHRVAVRQSSGGQLYVAADRMVMDRHVVDLDAETSVAERLE